MMVIATGTAPLNLARAILHAYFSQTPQFFFSPLIFAYFCVLLASHLHRYKMKIQINLTRNYDEQDNVDERQQYLCTAVDAATVFPLL